MNLDTSLKVLQIVLGEAKTTNDCDITASYADSMINNFSLGNQNEKSNGTTPVIVVAAPAIDTQRQVKEIRLFNNDTVPHNVTLQLFDGTNTWIVGNSPTATPVAVGGSFVYTPESGVCCTGSGGGGTSLTVEDDTGHTITSVGTLQMVGVVVSGSTPSAITNMTTITGPDGVGTANGAGVSLIGGLGGPTGTAVYGGAIAFTGGAGGSGTLSTYGGNITGRGGAGGAGTYALGGALYFAGGAGAGTNGPGGRAVFYGGAGFGSGQGGNGELNGGNSNGTGYAGNILARGGNGLGGGAGGNVELTTGTGTPPGRHLFNNDPSLIVAAYSWVAGAQLNNQTIFTTTRAMIVTAVIGRPDIVNGGAGTLVIVKAASGTAPAGGTALTSTSMDLTGTPDTNQTLTLSATLADIQLAAGDSLCMVTTGVLAASAGCITVWGTPQ